MDKNSPQKVLITGYRGTLGQALAQRYAELGWDLIGVSRSHPETAHSPGLVLVENSQQSIEDAQALLDLEADLIILNAGAIETELAPQGLPLLSSLDDLTTINALFPARLMLLASQKPLKKSLTIVAIGSIADGSPSCFGPLYHASKAYLHYFCSAVGPMIQHSQPLLQIRLYRPGVIQGPLAWAPVNRLNAKAYAIRARRCEKAPEASRVALRIQAWIAKGGAVGSDREPLSFLVLKLLFGLAPGLYTRVQAWAWRRAGRWGMVLSQPTSFKPQNS